MSSQQPHYVEPRGTAADLLFNSNFSTISSDARLEFAKEAVHSPTGATPSGELETIPSMSPMPMTPMPMAPTMVGPFNSTLEQQFPEGIVGVTGRARMSAGELQSAEAAVDYRRGRIAYKVGLQHSLATSYAPESTQLELRVEFGLGESAPQKSARKERADAINKKFEETNTSLRALTDALTAVLALPSADSKAATLSGIYTKFRSIAGELIRTVRRQEGEITPERKAEIKELLLESGVDRLIATQRLLLGNESSPYAMLLSDLGGYSIDGKSDRASSERRIVSLVNELLQ